MTAFAFYGTFTRGQPGHGNLRGARLLEASQTAARYRLWHVAGLWPALVPAPGDGVPISVEVYDVDEEHLARLAELEPPGWRRAPLELADGRIVEAFLGDETLRARGHDISHHGGWAAYAGGGGSPPPARAS